MFGDTSLSQPGQDTGLFAQVPRESASQAIEGRIKELIVAGRLVSGDVLPPERVFAAQLGVSRSTLREALRALTEEGIVTARQGSGWLVQPNRRTAAANLAVYLRLEEATFTEVAEARLTIEPTIARLAAARRTDDELAAIDAALKRMSALRTAAEFVDADSAFHALIAGAAGNALLSFSMLPTMTLLEEVRVAVVDQEESIAASQAEHARIVAAIRDRDEEGAEDAMREHIVRFQRRGAEIAKAAGR